MEMLHALLNLLLHLDTHLNSLVSTYGSWAYAILFLILFCETGLVITPFLPGDSLLFASGTLAANLEQSMNIHLLFAILVLASILGNTLNYFIGRFLSQRAFDPAHSRFLKPAYLHSTQQFYERHGGKTIMIARFMPIIRTFAPFVAGMGAMNFHRFFFYNVLGALLWVGSLLYVSYAFGNLSFVKDHFSAVIFSLIFLSLLPALIGYFRQR